jgi:phosphoribosylformylglycinamidine synthase
VGKAIHVELNAGGADEARSAAEEMCKKLLANPVTEDFEVYQVEEA